MAFALRAALCACALSAAAALYEEEEHVTRYEDAAAFEKDVVGDDSTMWIVHVYHTGDSKTGEDTFSEQFAPAFAEAAKELGASLGVKAACVDLGDEGMLKIGKKFNVMRIPSFLGFGGAAVANPYTRKVDRPALQFDTGAGFSKAAFKRWVSSRVAPTDVVHRVADEKKLAKLGGPVAVLLTERATTSALAKSLGAALRDRLAVAEVQVEDSPSELAAALGEGDLPRLLASKSAYASGSALDEFDGDLKDREAVLAWLDGYALKERKTKPAAAGKPDAAPAGDWPKDYRLETAADDAAFDARVLKAEPAIVAFRKGSAAPFAAKVLELDGAAAVDAVEVDCAAAASSPVCGGDATYAAYGHGAAAKAKKPLAVGGDGLAAFAAAAATLPAEDVHRVGSQAEMENFLRLAVSATEEDVAPVGLMVFTAKEEISPAVRALGSTLARHAGVQVGQWSNPDMAMVADYGIRKLPSVVAIFLVTRDPTAPLDKREMQIAPYPRAQFGPPTFQGLVAFATSVLMQVHPPAVGELQDALKEASRHPADASGGSSQSNKPAAAKGPVFQSLNTEAAWTARCGPDSSAALCAIALLDEHGRADTFGDELAVAEGVAKAEQPSPYAFGWVDGACFSDLAAAFDVYESSLPTFVAYAPKKERYAVLVGRYAASDVKAFLRGVVSGRVATAPLRAPLKAPGDGVDCAAVHTAKFAPAEEGDLEDDFLAELLAEEAAAKKALEEEAAAESKRLKDEAKAAKKAPPPKKKPKKKKKKSKKGEL